MKYPRELEGGGASPREMAMIRAARAQRAPARTREKTLSSLGLGGAIGSTSVVLHAAKSAAAAADGALGSAAAASGAKLAASGALIMGKWIAIGAITGFATLATGRQMVSVVQEHRTAAPSAAVVPPGAVAAAVGKSAGGTGVAEENAKPTAVVERSVPLSSPPSVLATRRSNASAGREAPARSSRATPTPLDEEVASLDDIRSALAGKSPLEAQHKLEAHQRKFAGGWLGEEALILQIETWVALGKRADATALAQSFLAEHPRSPYADRVRATVATAGDGR